ncbi:hypothetical protein [Rhodococcus sp. X156]|uniref:hypothetical protein n=1 Tax=Rhodococcus sp. X156 TaxID=2499145 RepID=UPI000FDA2614|nr:hypothetical protein [Rhodococcus sp. X156]
MTTSDEQTSTTPPTGDGGAGALDICASLQQLFADLVAEPGDQPLVGRQLEKELLRRARVPGDGHLAREVVNHLLRTTSSAKGRGDTATRVDALLQSTRVSTTVLAQAFGPQWAEVVAFVRRAGVLTADETQQIAAASRQNAVVPHPTIAVAERAERAYATRRVAEAALNASDDALSAANGGGGERMMSLFRGWSPGRDIEGAARALALRDLRGKFGFFQDLYDEMTWAWREVVGPLHPDDPELPTRASRTTD